MGSSPGVSDGWASEPIAIVGFSSKFAGDATDNEGLWRMLAEARSGWTPFPASRFRSEGVYHPNNERLNSTHVKGAHLLAEDVGLFDAAFFNYSSETASSLDPQYRLQLESVYEALENAGLPIAKIAGSNTSVFTGVFVHDYRDGLLRDADNLPRLMATGTGVPMMSNRVSHFFDLRGASLTIETACSSGMSALHQGVQSLRTGEADMSIVGGANLTLNPDMFKALGSAGFLSADGKCYAFDSRASGYGRGEGVGTLVIKRLRDARAAGDPIRAIIRESLINQDGKTETITTPSLEAQEALVRGCYRKAGLDPPDTQYFEAHGTGTQAGDTIEARAIGNVFASCHEPLLIGSVKTNIGHTEAASGLASIVKTALALEKGMIPPSINFEEPNPKLALEDWNLRLVRDVEKWPAARIRRASINNFGYGGANAHIIMEDTASWDPDAISMNGHSDGLTNGHTNGLTNGLSNGLSNGYSNGLGPAKDHVNSIQHAQTIQNDAKVLVLSAKDEQACQRMIPNLRDFVEQSKTNTNPQQFLESLVYTLGQRRTRFPWTAAHPIPVTKGIDAVLSAFQSPKVRPSRSSRKPRIGMVFTGQGAQWHAMGRELIDAYPVYKASLEEAERYLKELGADWSLIEEMSRDAESTRINEVGLSTPVCVALQISLANLLNAWGVKPVAVTSHSSGELAAAYVVGALSYRTAMAFAYCRGVLAGDKALRGSLKGGMIAVGLGKEDTESYLSRLTSDGKAVVACINSPSSITVSGDLSAVMELEDLANKEGVFARRLKVDAAWHSHHMAVLANAYAETLERMQTGYNDNASLNAVTFSSPVSGKRMTDAKDIAHPDHWVESLVQPVQFVNAFTDMTLGESATSTSNVDVVVEVGPHTALGGPIQEILAMSEFKELQIPYYGSLVRKTDARESMQALAASLLQEGYPIDMEAVNFPYGRGKQVKVLTNLPSYPWNHQVRHWVEPRLNKSLRERAYPPHDLLGSLVEGSNPEAPSWRHFLRVSESPWTRDHSIQANIVYPAAGYICLAVEAIKQITLADSHEGNQKVSGYRLRNVDFSQALMVPDNSEGIEIQTLMHPVSEKNVGARGSKHFEIWSVTADNRWTQHAKGLISIEFDVSSSDTDKRAAGHNEIEGYMRRVVAADLFNNLRALGIAHGPMFQNMKSITQSGSEMRSEVIMTVPDTSIPNDLPRDSVLHPVTLDSVVTSAYSALPGAGSREVAAKVPRSVESLWLSNDISNKAGHLFKVHSELTRVDSHGLDADVLVYDHDDGRLMLQMDRFSYLSLGRDLSLHEPERYEKELCSNVKWSPDLSKGTSATFDYVKKQLSQQMDPNEREQTLDIWRVCFYFMQQALLELTAGDVDGMEPHLAKYYKWMKETVQSASRGQFCPGSAEWLLEKGPERRHLIEQVAKTRVDGEMACSIGTHLVGMLKGEVSPFKPLIEDNRLFRFYRETPKMKRMGLQLSGLLLQLAHKNPRLRILEVGAGFGAYSRCALDALGTASTGGPHASLYHYTHASDAFFEAEQEALSAWSDLLSFNVLDIESDPATQGFTCGTYDVVIAPMFLHATKSIANTLRNVRSLLKPGGTLLLLEVVKCQVDVQFVYGVLPGWWNASEPERATDPMIPTYDWDRHLQKAGFTGVDVELRDCESDDDYTLGTIMSTNPILAPARMRMDPEKVVIVTSKKGAPPPGWLKELRISIAASIEVGGHMTPLVQDLESASATAEWYAGKICIFVGEVNEPILNDLTSASLEGIKAMSTGCKGLIWVTCGGAVDCERPDLSLATGFVRALRNEYVGRKLLTLDLDPKGPWWSKAGASAITQVLQSAFGSLEDTTLTEKGPTEYEYAERDGAILIPRIYHDSTRNEILSPQAFDSKSFSKAITEPLYQPDRPLCLQSDSLAFCDDSQAIAYLDSLPSNKIEVEPKAYGASLRPTDEVLAGVECAGVITRVGDEATRRSFAVGDRVVCVLQDSSFPSRPITDWTLTSHMPTRLSFEEAASLPVASLTAYFALFEQARLRRAQTVLVHDAARSLGQAAIMLAQHHEAEIFATVSSPEERKMINKQSGIPSDRIFSSTDKSFGAAIRAATKNHGVDVVLNSLTGALMQESFNLVAPFGCFVETGKHDLNSNSNLEMRRFARGVSFMAVDLPGLLEHRGLDVHRCLKEVMRLVEAKAVKPAHPLASYPIEEIGEVSRVLQKDHPMGKVVVSVSPHVKVPVLPPTATASLSPDASYLIVGGAGGLGQSVAHWMVSRGARNLVLLSRSAAKSEKMAELASNLREAGCSQVLPISCDVADEDHVANAIDQCTQEDLPPIRGIIHAAFVLNDSFVEKMTLDDYTYTTSSKVAGVHNLHDHFNQPGDLDFFVLFSSINGILGYASQAAYSAAGAYEDAFAHWRVKHCHLPAVSIDLSVVNAVGYVAEAASSEMMHKALLKAGRRAIDEDHVLLSLESAILSPYDPQFIVGGINSGPGAHWDADGDLGRDMRTLPMKYRARAVAEDATDASDSLAARMSACGARDEAVKVVGAAMATMLAEMFLVPVEDIDLNESPSQQGIDSLMAVEVRNMLFKEAAAELSIFNIMQSPSLVGLAGDVVDRSAHVKFVEKC